MRVTESAALNVCRAIKSAESPCRVESINATRFVTMEIVTRA